MANPQVGVTEVCDTEKSAAKVFKRVERKREKTSARY